MENGDYNNDNITRNYDDNLNKRIISYELLTLLAGIMEYVCL